MSPWDPDRRVRARVRGGDPLFLIYTSGTTGLPKAARFSHSRFMGGGTYALLAGFGRRDVLYCALPLYHTVGGVMCVNAVLRTGATLALARRFRASRFWQEAAESGATAFQYVGELCRYLLAQPHGTRTIARIACASRSATGCAPTCGPSSRSASASRRSWSSTAPPSRTCRW